MTRALLMLGAWLMVGWPVGWGVPEYPPFSRETDVGWLETWAWDAGVSQLRCFIRAGVGVSQTQIRVYHVPEMTVVADSGLVTGSADVTATLVEGDQYLLFGQGRINSVTYSRGIIFVAGEFSAPPLGEVDLSEAAMITLADAIGESLEGVGVSGTLSLADAIEVLLLGFFCGSVPAAVALAIRMFRRGPSFKDI